MNKVVRKLLPTIKKLLINTMDIFRFNFSNCDDEQDEDYK
jgi:pyruvate kinase